MGDHSALVPTQVANPWRAALRTFLAVAVPAVGLVLFVGPEILRILADELGAVFPPGFIAWLLGAAGVLSALASAVTRVMAIPRVNELLGRVKLDAGPPPSPPAAAESGNK